jgi:predicted nuclease with RNAse H fold
MGLSNTKYIGIDPSGGRQTFTYAVIDEDCQLVLIGSGEEEELLLLLRGQKATLVAFNAPRCPNKGLVRKKLEELYHMPGQLRGADMRLAEYELRERGISVSPTASRSETCAPWMQMGFEFYRKLVGIGFQPLNSQNATHQFLETHPHAAFCALLGQLLLPKPSVEGRLQRQLILYGKNMGIKNPMDYFEEITEHRLLKGILSTQSIYSTEELDALVAAFTAFMAASHPSEVVWIGNSEEGQIVLPVSVLKEVYTAYRP